MSTETSNVPGEERAGEAYDHDLPVIALDAAYRERAARHAERVLGHPPLWATATPEELADATRQWIDVLRRNREAESRPRTDIPPEALRREHLYEDR